MNISVASSGEIVATILMVYKLANMYLDMSEI